jgi:hypothetical protein
MRIDIIVLGHAYVRRELLKREWRILLPRSRREFEMKKGRASLE